MLIKKGVPKPVRTLKRRYLDVATTPQLK